MFVPAYAVAGGGGAHFVTGDNRGGTSSYDNSNSAEETVIEGIPTVPCPSSCMKCSYGVIPTSFSGVKAVGVPFTLLVRPLAVPTKKDGPVPLITRMCESLVRCGECSSFINPYASFSSDGSHWTCPICGYQQEVPTKEFSPINAAGQREDTASHPEFTHGCVEYMAPDGFSPRLPMAPSYVFVLDISRPSVMRGLLDVAIQAIRKWVSRYNDNRSARVSFVLYSRSVTYVQFIEKSSKYALYTVSDLDELTGSFVKERFFIRPESVMVSLDFFRDSILKFLDDLPTIVGKDGCNSDVGNSLPSALYAVIKFARFWGGRIFAFQGSSGACCDSGPFAVPSDVSDALLKRVAHPKADDDDDTLVGANALGASGDIYRELAVECCQRQTSVSIIAAEPVKGIAVLEQVAHFTGGSLVTVNLPQIKLDENEEEDPEAKVMRATSMRSILSLLCRQTAWESVMKLYCTDGVCISNATGNFFMRGNDLIATLCSDSGNTFCGEVKITSTLKPGQKVVIQSVYMYTTVGSKRRIRVSTICLPVTSSIHNVFNSLDVNVLAASCAKSVCESLQKCSLQEARENVIGLLMQAMKSYRGSFDKGIAPKNRVGLMLPSSLETLPLFLLALLKSPVLTKGRINGELRSKFACLFRSLPAEYLLRMIHPRLYDLNSLLGTDISSSKGSPGKLPQLPLSETSLQDGHVYLMDAGNVLVLYEHRTTDPDVLRFLFGVDSLSQVPLFQIITNTHTADGVMYLGNQVLHSFIELAETNSMQTPRIIIAKDIGESLVGDHTHSYYSYHEFVTMMSQ